MCKYILLSILILSSLLHANDENLLKVAKKGNLRGVNSAIEKGADVNATDRNDWTALIWASLNGHTEVVKSLVKAKARLNIQGKKGSTALYTASYGGDTEMAEVLIKAGALVNIKNNDGSTALRYASSSYEVVRLLKAAGAR